MKNKKRMKHASV